MAIYGNAFFGPARLDAAVADLGRVDLRRGRYAAAQLWKVTSVGGRHLDLAELIAPYLGDVEAVIPYHLVQVYRHIDAFRMPTREQHPNTVYVPVWAEEVRGMPVRYLQVGTLREHTRIMPMRATSRGYVDVRVPVAIDNLFNAAWIRRFGSAWPMVSTRGGSEVHPALQRLTERTAATNFAIRNNTIDQRTRVIARRRQLAAQHGMRVDHRGRVVGADDSSDSE